jgi:hypothetical protein
MSSAMQSARLEFVPHSPQGLRAMIESADQFAHIFGVPAAAGLRDFVASGEVSAEYLARLAAATEPDPWTFGFGVVHRADRLVIGAGGFKGPPTADGNTTFAKGVPDGAHGVCEIA